MSDPIKINMNEMISDKGLKFPIGMIYIKDHSELGGMKLAWKGSLEDLEGIKRSVAGNLQNEVDGLRADNAKAWDRVQYLQDHISMIRTDCLNGRFKDMDQVSNELFLAYQGEREVQ